MFCDCNVLYWAKREVDEGPDCDYYDALDARRWNAILDSSPAEFVAVIEARETYMYTYLDAIPLEHQPDMRKASFLSPVAPSRRWHAVVDSHRAQELEKWTQQQLQQQEQHVGAASKKQKL